FFSSRRRHTRFSRDWSSDVCSSDLDVIITEIGGTVGDIESQPFIEAARQLRHELGRGNVFFVHVSLVPFMGASGEQKTKPTQHRSEERRVGKEGTARWEP